MGSRRRRAGRSPILRLVARRLLSGPVAAARRDAKLNRLMRPARVRALFQQPSARVAGSPTSGGSR